MTGSCVFCEIVNGSRPHSIVSEDSHTIAFMSIRQQREGHVLVIPRAHVETVFGLDYETGAAVMATTVRIARAVEAAFQPQGLHLWQSNGPAAHQEVPHFHMHVMPRWHDDGLLQWHPTQGPIYPEPDELDKQAALIKSFVEGSDA
jgi:histidine triad (HIT) family protein